MAVGLIERQGFVIAQEVSVTSGHVAMRRVFDHWMAYGKYDESLRYGTAPPSDPGWVSRFAFSQLLRALPEEITVTGAGAAFSEIVPALHDPTHAERAMNDRLVEALRPFFGGLKPQEVIAHQAFWPLFPQFTPLEEAKILF